MGDRAQFDVILGDKVTASAKRQTAAIREYTSALTGLSAAARSGGAMPGTIGGAAVVGGGRARTGGGGAARPPAGFDANGRAGKAVARAQVREDNERRRQGEGIARAAAKADREEARAQAQQARERARDRARVASEKERAAATEARTADRVRKATEAAQKKTAAADEAAARRQTARIEAGWKREQQQRRVRVTTQARAGERARATAERATERSGGGGIVGQITRFGTAAAGLITVARAAADVGEALGRITYDAGAAYVSVGAFREGTIASLTTVMGNARSAERAFQNALVMANQTPLDPEQVIGMMTSFSVGGFGEAELEPLVAAASDISAARGQAASDSLVRVLTQIRGLGRVTRGDITMQALSAGLNAGDIFGSIAEQMNLGTGTAGIRAAEQAVGRGRVNDTIAINAFMASTRRRYDGGGALGTFARNQSDTIGGALSNLRGAMFTLMASADLSHTPGLIAVKNAILAVNGALDMGSDTGKRFRGAIIEAGNIIGVGLFGGVNRASAGRFVDMLSSAIPVIAGIVKGVADLTMGFGGGLMDTLGPAVELIGELNGGDSAETWKDFGRVVGQIVGVVVLGLGVIAYGIDGLMDGVAGIIEDVLSIPDAVSTLVDQAGQLGTDASNAIVDGFENGILEGAARMADAVGGAFGEVVASARDVLGWNSPSRVFMEAGHAVAEGFSIGVNGGAPAAAAAVSAMLASNTTGGASAGAARGAGGSAPSVTIIIQGAGMDANAIVDLAVEKFTDVMESMALQGATNGVTNAAA